MGVQSRPWRKTLSAVALFGAAALMTGGCVSGATDSAGEGRTQTTTESKPPISGVIKVGAVYTAPISQQWNSRVHAALLDAKSSGDITYEYTDNVAVDDEPKILEQYAQQGFNLIVGDSFGSEQQTRDMASRYPGVNFLMASSLPPSGGNYSVFDNYIQEPSYLCGMAVAGASKNGKVGIVAGFPIPEVNRLANAFIAGAKEIRPDVKMTVTFINSWYDPGKTVEAANAQMDEGVDVIYAERSDAITAVKKRGLLAAGNVVDSGKDNPDTVVCSALWNFTPTVKAAIEKVRSGSFTAENYADYGLMKNGGSTLSSFYNTESKIPATVRDKIVEKTKQFKSGQATIEIDNAVPKSIK